MEELCGVGDKLLCGGGKRRESVDCEGICFKRFVEVLGICEIEEDGAAVCAGFDEGRLFIRDCVLLGFG
jgi:hypothetical protein